MWYWKQYSFLWTVHCATQVHFRKCYCKSFFSSYHSEVANFWMKPSIFVQLVSRYPLATFRSVIQFAGISSALISDLSKLLELWRVLLQLIVDGNLAIKNVWLFCKTFNSRHFLRTRFDNTVAGWKEPQTGFFLGHICYIITGNRH